MNHFDRRCAPDFWLEAELAPAALLASGPYRFVAGSFLAAVSP